MFSLFFYIILKGSDYIRLTIIAWKSYNLGSIFVTYVCFLKKKKILQHSIHCENKGSTES